MLERVYYIVSEETASRVRARVLSDSIEGNFFGYQRKALLYVSCFGCRDGSGSIVLRD
jgi:hypothetical protein